MDKGNRSARTREAGWGRAPGTGLVIDLSRIRRLLAYELGRYWAGFQVDPHSELQQLRGLMITWLAVFLPETFTPKMRDGLRSFSWKARSFDEFWAKGWYRTLPLDSALFALTGDVGWVETARLNLDHMTSSLRAVVQDSLIFVADRLQFADQELQTRIEASLANGNMYADQALALLAVSQGDPAAKCAVFSEWLQRHAQCRVLNERAALETLAAGHHLPNPLLSNVMLVEQYVMLRFACAIPPSRQLALPDATLSQALWRRLAAHPVRQRTICLRTPGGEG